jgi:hypothetical protein
LGRTEQSGWSISGSRPSASRFPLSRRLPEVLGGTESAGAKPATIILHSQHDDVVPLEHSRQLVEKSKRLPDRLVIVGESHRMNDEAALQAILEAVERAVRVC